MKRIILAAAFLALLGSAGGSWSDDFNRAYKGGDYATALREVKPLAEQGNAVAQTLLGMMYYIGRGVPQDYKTAVKWYRRAAEQGIAEAQYNLGVMYTNGHGVPQDNVYAHMWASFAASNGNEIGAKHRDDLAKKMTPSQIEKARDLARECIRDNYKGC